MESALQQLQFLDLEDLDHNELEVVHSIIYSNRSNNLSLPWPDQSETQPSWNEPSQPQTPHTAPYDGQGGDCGDGSGGGAGGDVYPMQTPVATTIPQLYHTPVVPPQIPNIAAAYMPNMHGFAMQQYHNPPMYPSEPATNPDQRGNRRPRPSKPSPKRTERRDHPNSNNTPYPPGPQPPHMSHPYVPPQPTPPAYHALHPVPIPNPYSYISPTGHMPSAQHAAGHHIYLPPLMYSHQTLYGQFPPSVYAPNIQHEELKHPPHEQAQYDNKQDVSYEKKEFEEVVVESSKKPEEVYEKPSYEAKEPEVIDTPVIKDTTEELPPQVNHNNFPVEEEDDDEEEEEPPPEETPPPPPDKEEKEVPAVAREPSPAPVSPANSTEAQPVDNHNVEKTVAKSLPINAIKTTALPPNLSSKRRPQLGEEGLPSMPPTPQEGKSWAGLFKMGGSESPKPAAVPLKIPPPPAPAANKPLPARNHIRPPINAVAVSAPPCFDPALDGAQTKAKSKHGDHPQVANFYPGKQGVNHQNVDEVVDPGLKQIGKFLSNYSLEHKASCLLIPRGLSNPSNYCYINATLQALLACPPFYNLIKDIAQVKDKVHCSPSAKSKTPIIDSMVQFIREFKPGAFNRYLRREKAQARKEEPMDIPSDPPFEPTYVYKMLHNLKKENGFHVEGRQEDAEEFLSLLLNGLNDEMLELLKLAEEPKHPPISNGDLAANGDTNHDDWKEVTKQGSRITRRTELERTPLSDIFRGELRCRLHRTHDEATDNVQPFFTLQLDIESAETVSKALEKLVGMDPVEGLSSGDIDAWQQQSLNQLPCVLILHLKCFHYRSQTCSKIAKALEFPIDLKLEPKLLSKTFENTKTRHYKLFAVVYHDGKEASKGHYLSDVFHVGTGHWIRYDDATVQIVGDSTVLHPKPPRVPYLLYYRRLDTIGNQQSR